MSPRRWSSFAMRGALVGALAGALWGLMDVPIVCVRGQRVPFALPVLLLVIYLTAGALVGALIATLALLRSIRPESRDRSDAGICRGMFIVSLGLAIALFAQRATGGGWDAIESGMGPGSGVILVVAILGAIWIASRGKRNDLPPATFVGRVLCLAAFSALWAPLNAAYQAPALSPISAGVNGGYLVALLLLYSVVRRAGRPIARRVPLTTPGHWFRLTLGVTALSLVVSWSVLAACARQPLMQQNTTAVSAPQASPNVILVVLDTTRADRLSVYGYAKNTTPHLADFARSSVVYQQAVAPTSWTLPSHATIFTGLMPTEHGAHWYPHGADGQSGAVALRLVPDADTLAEKLEARGYDTAAVVGNSAMLSRTHGIEQGFRYYDDRSRSAIDACRTNALSPAQWVCAAYRGVFGRGDTCRYADEVTDDVFDWLDQRAGRPFFLFVNYLDPHEPYIPHPAYRRQLGHPAAGVTDHSLIYDEEIAYLDGQLGRLFEGLRRRGLLDDALIVVTGDHGEAFGEHGNWQHGQTLYQEEVHVPLLVRYPQGRIRGVRDEPTSLVVLSAMILNAIGADGPTPAAVQSWQPFASAIAELHHHGRSAGTGNSDVTRAIYTEDGLKIILRVGPTQVAEVYDLTTDPGEQHNLTGDSASLEKLGGSVQSWAADARARRLTSGGQVQLDDALREQLRALGYLE